MPRVNLTEAEAEAIRRTRQHAAEHAVTWNEALAAAEAALNAKFNNEIDQGEIATIMLSLLRTVPKPPKE